MSQAIHGSVGTHHGIADVIAHRALGAWHALKREVALRQDLHALASLDDTGLADVGVSRGGLDDAVRHGRPRLAHTGAAPAYRDRLPADVTVEWR